MEVVYVVVGIMIGFVVSSIIRRKHPVGFLRIDKSDSDGPYLFLELKGYCERYKSAFYLLIKY